MREIGLGYTTADPGGTGRDHDNLSCRQLTNVVIHAYFPDVNTNS
jgi:hypothetical protein